LLVVTINFKVKLSHVMKPRKCGMDNWVTVVRLSARKRQFFFLQNVPTSSRIHAASYPISSKAARAYGRSRTHITPPLHLHNMHRDNSTCTKSY